MAYDIKDHIEDIPYISLIMVWILNMMLVVYVKIRINYTHKYEDGYHIHGEYGLMIDCVLDIVEHDEWKLGIWRHKRLGKIKQPKTYFDWLIDTYCRVPAYA